MWVGAGEAEDRGGAGNGVDGGYPQVERETTPWSWFLPLPSELILAVQGQGPT